MKKIFNTNFKTHDGGSNFVSSSQMAALAFDINMDSGEKSVENLPKILKDFSSYVKNPTLFLA